jgi:hypothetical protein
MIPQTVFRGGYEPLNRVHKGAYIYASSTLPILEHTICLECVKQELGYVKS